MGEHNSATVFPVNWAKAVSCPTPAGSDTKLGYQNASPTPHPYAVEQTARQTFVPVLTRQDRPRVR